MAKKGNIGLWNTFMLHFNSDNIQSILYCTFVAKILLVDNNKDIVLKLGGSLNITVCNAVLLNIFMLHFNPNNIHGTLYFTFVVISIAKMDTKG